jgi:hypothetical protein
MTPTTIPILEKRILNVLVCGTIPRETQPWQRLGFFVSRSSYAEPHLLLVIHKKTVPGKMGLNFATRPPNNRDGLLRLDLVYRSTAVASCSLVYGCYKPKRRNIYPSITSLVFGFSGKFLD